MILVSFWLFFFNFTVDNSLTYMDQFLYIFIYFLNKFKSHGGMSEFHNVFVYIQESTHIQ